MRNQSLWQTVKLYSASQVTYKQFLLFRTIVLPIVCPEKLNVSELGVAARMTQASQILTELAFVEYLTNVTVRQTQPLKDISWGGSDRLFRIPAIQQQDVIRSEAKKSSFRGQSEANVNTSFVSFLQAIADLVPQSTRQWTANRIRLTADFSTRQRERTFVAHTDGHLEDRSNSQILALIECKNSRREDHTPAVDMQEVAQMVAWVKEHPGEPNRRVLVAQNGTDLHISVFECSEG